MLHLIKVAPSPTDTPPPTNPPTTPPTTPSITDPPLVVSLAGRGTQTAGQTYILLCAASGGGTTTPTYQWRKDGALLTTPSRSDRFGFSRLEQGNSGEYTCTVSSGI